MQTICQVVCPATNTRLWQAYASWYTQYLKVGMLTPLAAMPEGETNDALLLTVHKTLHEKQTSASLGQWPVSVLLGVTLQAGKGTSAHRTTTDVRCRLCNNRPQTWAAFSDSSNRISQSRNIVR